MPGRRYRLNRDRARPRLLGRLIIGVLAILVVLLLLRLMSELPIFSIKSITVIGDPGYQVTSQINTLTSGQNLLFLDQTKITASILKNLTVKKITFNKTLPSALTARVEFRSPALAWQGVNGTFLVDDQGFIYQQGTGNGLVVIHSTYNLKLGQTVSPDTISKLLTLINKNNSAVTAISINQGSYQATLTGGVMAFFDPNSDLASESQALQLILTKAKIDGKLPRTVDLRFPKPVVTF